MVLHGSITLCVRIDSMVFSRSVAIQHHAKAHRLPVGGWAEDKVQVSCMEAEDDLAPSSFERSRLFMVEPLSSESLLIELEVCRLHVDMIGVSVEAALRREMLSAGIADMRFGRADIFHIGCCLNALSVDAGNGKGHRLPVRFFEQLRNQALRLVILPLAKMRVSHLAFGVDKVVGRPIPIMKGVPDDVVAIDGNGIRDSKLLYGLLDIRHLLFDIELGRMNTDDHKSTVFVLVGPGAEIRDRPNAVDAGVIPKVDEHNLAFEVLRR